MPAVGKAPGKSGKKYAPQIASVPESGGVETGGVEDVVKLRDADDPGSVSARETRPEREDWLVKKLGRAWAPGVLKRDILSMLPHGLLFTIIVWTIAGATGRISAWNERWPMALIMALGSLIGGGTPFGDGAVSFPFMTLLFDESYAHARDLTFIAQATGMLSASLTMFLAGIPVDYFAVAYSSLGGVFGVVIGLQFVGLYLDSGVIKMIFISLVLGIAWGVAYLNQTSDRRVCDQVPVTTWRAKLALVAFGFLGGVMCGISGSGIDTVMFGCLVILFRVDERTACSTSVVIAAINSLLAYLYSETILRAQGTTIDDVVYDYWFVVAPISIIFAPLGAQIAVRVDRKYQARFVYVAAVVQFVFKAAVTVSKYADMFLLYIAAVIVLISSVIFTLLMHAGTYYDEYGKPVNADGEDGSGNKREAWADKRGSTSAGSVIGSVVGSKKGSKSSSIGSKLGMSVLTSVTSMGKSEASNWDESQLSGATKLFQRASKFLRLFTYIFCTVNAGMCIALLLIQNWADHHVNTSVKQSLDRMDAVHNASYCHELLTTAASISEYGHSYYEEQLYFANAPCSETTVGSFDRLEITKVPPLSASKKYFSIARTIEYAALNDHNAYKDIVLGFEFYRATLKHTHEELVWLQDQEHEQIYDKLKHAVDLGVDISIPILVLLFQALFVYARKIVFNDLDASHQILLDQIAKSEKHASRLTDKDKKSKKANKAASAKASSSVVAWLDAMQLMMAGLAILQLTHVAVLTQTINDTQTTALSTLSFSRDVAADGEVLYRKAWLEVHKLTDNDQIVLSDDSLIDVYHPEFSAFGQMHEHLVELVEEAEEVHDHFLYELEKTHDAVLAGNGTAAAEELYLVSYDHDLLDVITHELQDELRIYMVDVLHRLSVSHTVSLVVSILILVLTVLTVYQLRSSQKKREKSDKSEQAELSWPLEAVLDDKVMRKAFLMFALSRHCQEMVKFHIAVTSLLKKVADGMPCAPGLKRLYKRFLEPSSPDEINISHELSVQVRSIIILDFGKGQDFVSDDKMAEEMERILVLLNECRDEVMKLMLDNLYQPFVRDPKFETVSHKRNEELEQQNLNKQLLADADLDD